jgi:signal transduction histidine kinase
MLSRAESQARRLSDLVEELIDIAQLNLGHLKLEPSEVDLAALVREVTESRAADIQRRGVTLTIVGEPLLIGYWDRARIEHIVSNLLSNATKFGAGRPVEISITRHAQSAELQIRDHGAGIPHDRLPFVFDRFVRAASITHYGGFGLGLFVVRSLVEAHGGSIRAESEQGSGSTFIVDLPLPHAGT